MRGTTVSIGGRMAHMRKLGALWLALGLCGCALITPPGPPPTTFDLQPSAGAVADGARRAGATVIVAEPTALSALNSERIVARPSPTQITYFGGAQWSDRLPALVQTRTIHALENAAWLRSVGRPSDALTADYRLMSDIRAFGVEVGAAPTASVEIAVKLVNDRTGRIVAARVFRAAVPAAAKDAAAGVAALDAALGQVLAEMVAWASHEHLSVAATSVTETVRGREAAPR